MRLPDFSALLLLPGAADAADDPARAPDGPFPVNAVHELPGRVAHP